MAVATEAVLAAVAAAEERARVGLEPGADL